MTEVRCCLKAAAASSHSVVAVYSDWTNPDAGCDSRKGLGSSPAFARSRNELMEADYKQGVEGRGKGKNRQRLEYILMTGGEFHTWQTSPAG